MLQRSVFQIAEAMAHAFTPLRDPLRADKLVGVGAAPHGSDRVRRNAL
jgi:hypothetical protein